MPSIGDHAGINVAAQANDPTSMLALYRRLIALRRAHPALTAGSLEALSVHDDVLTYERRTIGERLAIVLNLGARGDICRQA